MQIVPLQAQPAQTVSIALNNQACRINVYTLNTGIESSLFVDLYVNDALIIGGVIAQNANPIVRDAYLGFVGDIAFYDLQSATAPDGPADPIYTDLGTRFVLGYSPPPVIATGQVGL